MAAAFDQAALSLPALMLALLATVWAASMGMGGAQELIALSKADKQSLLDSHNLLRSLTAQGKTGSQPPAGDMMLLEWDDRLQSKAAAWATQCQMGHDSASFRSIPGHSWVGQNWAGGGNTNLSYFVQLWYNEHVDYTYDTNYCTDGKQCGHYTQVVWARSLLMGCAAAKCTNFERVLVCNYADGGNVGSNKPYEKASTPASACVGEFRFKRNGLCRRQNQCSNTATGGGAGTGGGTGTGGGAGTGDGTTTSSSGPVTTTTIGTTTPPSGGGDNWGEWGDWSSGDDGWEEGQTMGRKRLARQRRQADSCPCALNCKNGGTLDEANCKCNCKPEFYGTNCEVPCQDPSEWRSNCEGDPDACKNFAPFCPKTCGGCRVKNITDTAAENSDGIIGRA